MHESSIPGTIGGKSGRRDKQIKTGTIQGNPGRLASMIQVKQNYETFCYSLLNHRYYTSQGSCFCALFILRVVSSGVHEREG